MNLPLKKVTLSLMALALMITPSLAEWSNETATGTLSGNLWTPGRGSDGRVTAASVATLPTDTWIQVAGTKADDQLEPLLVAGGYKPIGLAASMFIYSGMAFDPVAGKSYQTGGGHSGGGDNGIYSVDFYKMAWEVSTWPSKPGVDLTLEETAMYIYGSQGGNSYAANITTDPSSACYVYPYSKSSTGFAVKYWNSESNWMWCEAVGPAGMRHAGEILFPGDIGMGTQAAADYFTAHNHVGREALRGTVLDNDVLPDGRPTSRHQYGGLSYNAARQEVQSAVRSLTRAKTDGSGWVNFDSGGYQSYPSDRVHSEMIWNAADDSTGEIWTGGCGSDCWTTNYFYYISALILNPATGQVRDAPRMNKFEWYDANCQVYWAWLSVVTSGRWLVGCSGDVTKPWGMFNRSTQEKRSIRLTGTPFNSSQGEGIPFVYVSDLDQVWAFDPSNRLACSVVDFAHLTPNSIYPGDTYDAVSTPKVLANSEVIPLSSTLIYNRIRYWDKEKMLVFVNASNQNVWVCKVATPDVAKEARSPMKGVAGLKIFAKPNPFNPTTQISFSSPLSAKGLYSIYDGSGKVIRSFVVGAGTKNVAWDSKDKTGKVVAAGVYTGRLVSGSEVCQHQLVLSK